MDPGRALGHPAFFVEQLELTDDQGAIMARLQPGEPVSQHPTVTLILRPQEGTPALRVRGRDTDGNTLQGTLPLAWPTSAL
jgi:sulfur-oxidizing protein SoxY